MYKKPTISYVELKTEEITSVPGFTPGFGDPGSTSGGSSIG